MNRPFLHVEIYDSNNPQLNARTFQKCKAREDMAYDGRFREAFPTMWACAYELDKLVQAYGKGTGGDLAEHLAAVEEWAVLLVLYYSGVINHQTIHEHELVDGRGATSDYDPDLWPALSGTFPGHADNPLRSVTLLRADDEGRTVVGAYYPHIVFFPSRGRAAWRESPVLGNYLQGNPVRLSWAKCYAKTVKTETDRAELAQHLASVGETLGGAYGTAINKFCSSRGLPLPPGAARFNDENPFAPHAGWKRVVVEDAARIMEAYPLIRETTNNGVRQRRYYLVQGLRTLSPWMSDNFGRGMPTPQLVRQRTEKEVAISWAGRELTYTLKKTSEGHEVDEEVVLLKDLFLDKPAYWCKPPETSPSEALFTAFIEGCHKQEVNSHTNHSRELKKLCGDTALILAPINQKFIQHFGYLDEQNHYGAEPHQLERKLKRVECATVDEVIEGETKEGASWTFVVTNKDGAERPINWTEMIEQSPKLPNKSVAIWPPKVSTDWRLYAIRSRGEKKRESGAWALVDENGNHGKPVQKDEDENLSVLHDPQSPNRPVALMLLDAVDHPRGIFFLKLQASVIAQDSAYLGVDFGTSNTCLAYAQDNSAPETLVFSLSPRWLWGRPLADTAGFVPHEWHGQPFYSTVLLAPKSNPALGNKSSGTIEAVDLFQVDIPVLHKGLADSLYSGGLEANWNAYPDLKWDVRDENRAWRAFFLSLSLVYAHAELLFSKGMQVAQCVWTYPLAFSGGKDTLFKEEADAVLKNVQELCYGRVLAGQPFTINESQAIATSEGTEGEGRNYVDLFIDIGGGSTDIAVYANDHFLVQDSVEVAGRAFFSFAEESVDPSHPYTKFDTPGARNFRENLSRLLRGTDKQFTKLTSPAAGGQAFTADMYRLGTYYSIIIGNLPEAAADGKHSLTMGERKIINGANGPSINNRSYQTYRSLLFYRHLISYGLLQACAAAMNDSELDPRFRIICSGNGWGLTLFAGLNKGGNTVKHAIKHEADRLLKVIKAALLKKVEAANGTHQQSAEDEKRRQRIEALTVGEVKFLGRGVTKTAVARGAAKIAAAHGAAGAARNGDGGGARMVCYTGLKLDPLKVNGQSVSVDWLDRWATEELLSKVLESDTGLKSIEFGRLHEDGQPCDPLLTVFVQPRDKWGELNSVVRKSGHYERNKQLTKSPVNQLLARVLYPRGDRHFFLENMAQQEECE